MITRERIFGKKDPRKDAVKIYVICEGESDEPRYFRFFMGLSSNMNIITIPSEHGHSDPQKLSEMAAALFETGRLSLDYENGDRIWFVVDTDAWEDEGKIAALRHFCDERNGEVARTLTKRRPYAVWNVAQSNPCFEIWLYYHFYATLPETVEVIEAASFKEYVNGKISGGFNYNSDPVRLKAAITNAEANWSLTDGGLLSLYTTEMPALGREIFGFVSSELAKMYNKLS